MYEQSGCLKNGFGQSLEATKRSSDSSPHLVKNEYGFASNAIGFYAVPHLLCCIEPWWIRWQNIDLQPDLKRLYAFFRTITWNRSARCLHHTPP